VTERGKVARMSGSDDAMGGVCQMPNAKCRM
jgi:hypothetical protein